MQLAGIDISSDASMAEVAERMREYTLIVRGNTEFVEGTYIRSLGDAIFDGLMSKELVSIETELPVAINQSWMSQQNNIELKRFVAPNATAMNYTYLTGCTSLEYLDCPVYDYDNFGASFPSTKLRYVSIYGIKQFVDIPASFPEYFRAVGRGFYSTYTSPAVNTRHIIVPNFYASPGGNSRFDAFPLVYDFRSMTQVSSNVNVYWYGHNVNMSAENMNTYSEWDDPNQPHFANNGEKMLWYFKHHFLYMDDGTPAFADMSETTAPTLTLGANLRDLVMQDEEVVEYFTSRNWIVA
jgi:hypothetical protein